MSRRLIGSLAAFSLGASLIVPLAASMSTPAAASPPSENDAIVQLFEWNWNSIASECTNVLGPKGYRAVQTSPPQEHIVLPGNGYPWWQDYQPISYTLTTRRGNEEQYAAMISACHAAGVKVYADVVLNHMQGAGQSGVGSAGNSYSEFNDPGVPYTSSDFHSPCAIQDWTNRTQVQTCELENLTDLRTESSDVRTKEDEYLNHLISLGIDGFRMDAAKHMADTDIQAIEAGLTKQVYVYQEVIEGGNGEVSPTEYTGTGDVTDFRYGTTVGNDFKSGTLSNLNNVASQMLLPSNEAQVFVNDHDTERNGQAPLNYKSGDRYYLANGFMLAFPFGSPSIVSGYNFSSPDQGPPSTSDGTTLSTDCTNGWTCEDRDIRIANMVGFRNATRGTAVTNWWSNGGDQIAFGRGSNGYVVFNTDGNSLTRTFQTSLPAGTYCDVMSGNYSGGSCSGNTMTVASNGTFTATVGANKDLAIDTAAQVNGGGSTSTPTPTPTPTGSCTPSSTVTVNFDVNATTTLGTNIFVVGDIAALGGWNTSNAIAMSSASYPIWTASLNMAPNTAFQYKYIRKDSSGNVTWESTPNRVKTAPSSGSVTYNDTFSNTSTSTTQGAGCTPTPTPAPSQSTSSSVNVTFNEYATTSYGQNVYVIGSIAALGSWNTASAIPLSSAGYPTWSASFTLPATTAFQYKYIKKNPDGSITWESDPNRSYTTGTGGSATLNDSWR